jgi:hypothetical protein
MIIDIDEVAQIDHKAEGVRGGRQRQRQEQSHPEADRVGLEGCGSHGGVRGAHVLRLGQDIFPGGAAMGQLG